MAPCPAIGRISVLKSLLAIFLAIVVAILGGAGSVWLALEQAPRFGTASIGPWVAYPEIGTPDADPYSRARFAREGSLALGQAEGVVFTARRDSAGRELDPSCTYRLEGELPPARFWTLYAIDAEAHPTFQAASPDARVMALNSQALLRDEDGTAAITLARSIQPGNWLKTPAEGPFGIVLTLYDTTIAGSARIAGVAMPSLTQVSCNG